MISPNALAKAQRRERDALRDYRAARLAALLVARSARLAPRRENGRRVGLALVRVALDRALTLRDEWAFARRALAPRASLQDGSGDRSRDRAPRDGRRWRDRDVGHDARLDLARLPRRVSGFAREVRRGEARPRARFLVRVGLTFPYWTLRNGWSAGKGKARVGGANPIALPPADPLGEIRRSARRSAGLRGSVRFLFRRLDRSLAPVYDGLMKTTAAQRRAALAAEILPSMIAKVRAETFTRTQAAYRLSVGLPAQRTEEEIVAEATRRADSSAKNARTSKQIARVNEGRAKDGKFVKHNRCECCGERAGADYWSTARYTVACDKCAETEQAAGRG